MKTFLNLQNKSALENSMGRQEKLELQLEQWRVPVADYGDWNAKQLRVFNELQKLPTKVCSIGLAVFNLDASGEPVIHFARNEDDRKKNETRNQWVVKWQPQIESLSAKDRKKIFAVLGTDLTESIEAAWQFLKTAPYKIGYCHSPFRAPKNPEHTLPSRIEWLNSFASATARYQSNILTPAWLAAWAKHAFDYQADCVTPILIAAMNAKGKAGDEVFDTLYKTVTREHPFAIMADFVIESLLGSTRTEGWAIIEKTLLAAQRQEGLRQSILSGADMAHPEAFCRLLRLIVDEDMIRFSSVARCVNVWLRLLWDSASTKVLRENVEAVLKFLESPAERKRGLASKDAETVYRALWVSAHEDAVATVALADSLLKNSNDEIRYVAVWILTQLDIESAKKAKADVLDDQNLQIAVLASCGLNGLSSESEVIEKFGIIDGGNDSSTAKDYFERVEKLYQRLPEKPETLKAIVWPWTTRKIQRTDLCGQLLTTLGDRPPTRILPYLSGLDSWKKSLVVELLSQQNKWDGLTRSTLIQLAGHASADVRAAAFNALKKPTLLDDEYLVLEDYLSRTAVDLRRGVIAQVVKQADPKALASSQRLLAAKSAKKRLAGLEIIRQMAESDRSRKDCQQVASDYRSGRTKISKEEEVQLNEIANSEKTAWTMDDALGLMNPAGRSNVKRPLKKKVPRITKTALQCLKSLDELVHQNRAVSVRYRNWRDWHEELLGAIEYGLPNINLRKPLAKQFENFPLWETWTQWCQNRPAKLRDPDGLELMRALVALSFMDDYVDSQIRNYVKKPDQKKIVQAILGEFDGPKLRYFRIVRDILQWLFYSEIPGGALDYLFDCTENTGAYVTDAMLKDMPVLEKDTTKKKRNYWDIDDNDWRRFAVFRIWPEFTNSFCNQTKIEMSVAQERRQFELDRFWDEPVTGVQRQRVDFSQLAAAYLNEFANYNDLVDSLLGPGRDEYVGYNELSQLTERNLPRSTREFLANTKRLPELVNKIRSTLLEIELNRGEQATVSTQAILSIKSFYGIETLFRILAAVNGTFKVLAGWNANTEDSRPATLTELVKVTYPLENETVDDFVKHANQAIADGYFSEEQLLELAFLAPQWSKFVGEMLGWDGFSEGLYWFLAHMNTWMSDATAAAATAEGLVNDEDGDEELDADGNEDDDNAEPPPKLSAWQRLILERTPLKPAERSEGAVDVDWFHRTFALLGEKRWKTMAASAKLAANSAQAKKAQFLADALLGKTRRNELVDGIKKRYLKENVRLLGLLPLAPKAKRDPDILERYEVLLAYKKYARGLSSLAKPDAMRALEIGMSNLARLAGYPDPLRLEWALEAESIKDLAKGPVSITKDGVTVTLRLDGDAKPEMTVQRGEKSLKSIPAPLKKKHAALGELSDRATELRKKSSRIKQSLEAAMCRGDAIDAAELMQLMQHAILAPNLKRIVLIGDGIAGYPDKDGKVLRDHSGKFEPIKKRESLRIAHPADLLKLGDWHKWQHECFQAERLQPFKQVFRELYVLTKKEKNATSSTRFAGHQIGPKQAMALWNSRGWNTQEEVIKVFHDRSIIASVSFQFDIGTAAEVEGLTVESVQFQNRDTSKPLKLNDVPATVFSEVMRDIDLVVSVAHRGEVDPEASESTVEMRATLVRETCQLLGLNNVKFQPSHVVIDGYYGEYSLHLGSGGIHRLPGGSLAIIPVHAQHRGRLFLPFADNDPKTAEIVSKVILLARDEEILDPTILDQLGAPLKQRARTDEDLTTQSNSSVEKSPKRKKANTPKTGGDGVTGDVAAVPVSKRRFEFSEGTSNKFWEIELSDDSITTTWGRIGTNGQSKTKSFANEARAKQAFAILIEEKTEKGYTETT